ncbi:hypothetical protein TOK_5015 [Pseudonocardia sp. N23]|nr:hypothetical protein TOK_5015 [Pseudonocardia sp. N23]
MRLVLRSNEGVLVGSEPLPQALSTLDLSVDDPDRFVATIAERIQQPAPPA